MDTVEITELEKIDATRVDGVGVPANGIPILLMKAVTPPVAKAGHAPMTGTHSHPHPAFGAQDGGEPHEHEHSHDGDADHRHSHAAKSFDREAAKSLVRGIIAKAVGAGGEVDEEPDVQGGTEVLARIADLIIAEAQELKAGQAGEICDILELACAAEKIWCWRTGEEAVSTGSVVPATVLAQSAAGVEKDGPSAAERRKAADEGNALPDGSYPIRNAHELHSAAILARSGHGDVAAAKRPIARRAKELGVKNPLEDGDTSKSQIAEGGTDVDTVTQETDGSFAKAVEDAVTKAIAPLAQEIADLKSAKDLLADELAKVKAMPVLGGPVMSAARPQSRETEDHAAKARDYDAWSQTVSDPSLADKYRQLAARHRDAISVQ